MAWYVGPATGRTDPFVPWACEAMQARTGLRVRRTLDITAADIVCTTRPDAEALGLRGMRPIAWRGGQSVAGVGARARWGGEPARFVAFLAGRSATAQASWLGLTDPHPFRPPPPGDGER